MRVPQFFVDSITEKIVDQSMSVVSFTCSCIDYFPIPHHVLESVQSTSDAFAESIHSYMSMLMKFKG